MEFVIQLCACGAPLHYTDKAKQQRVQMMIDALGEDVKVTVAGRSWMVPRHYIALHGIQAAELPFMGFKEVGKAV